MQSVGLHLWRQASQSYFIVHLTFLNAPIGSRAFAPSESADTQPLCAHPHPERPWGHTLVVWLPQGFRGNLPAPASCSGSPGPPVPGHLEPRWGERYRQA